MMKDVQTFVGVTKALADASRVRVLLALRPGELCVCQLTELLGFAPSTVSRHLSLLESAGLVVSRKSERWVYYRLPGRAAPASVRAVLAWVHRSVGTSPEAVADARRLQAIMKQDAKLLSRSQCC
jgi:DNA-binding transcriptional ArsR family regulator